ncbi:RTA1-like protein [Mycena floridula]|nr:RTA1-like protein [Mycena floridula]
MSTFFLLLLSVFGAVLSKPTGVRPEDPFADPKNDVFNPLRYIANNALTAVAFALILLVAFSQTWCMIKWPSAKWMMSMVIGAYTFATGLGLRFGLHSHPESKGIYIAEYLFVVLSPCAFIAANYVVLGRLAIHLQSEEFLLVSPRRITVIFVSSDIVTFLIQAAGGSLTISNDQNMRTIGSHLFLTGLALQLASFVLFTITYVVFLYRVYKTKPETFFKDSSKPWFVDWRALAFAISISCVGILIRSFYRTVELSEGYQGHLATTEAFFYALDTLPLFLATVVYVPFWPGRFIPGPSIPAEKD